MRKLRFNSDIRKLAGIIHALLSRSSSGWMTISSRSTAGIATLAFFVAACAGNAPPGSASPLGAYDVVISNGKIVDGTGNPWYYGDVGIKGDRIAAITPAGALASAGAAKRIDAKGMVIAPGFIDIQGQSAEQLTTGDGRLISKITQGVTTEILGEGETPAPVNDKILATFDASDTAGIRVARQFTGDRGFGAWLDAMQKHGISV